VQEEGGGRTRRRRRRGRLSRGRRRRRRTSVPDVITRALVTRFDGVVDRGRPRALVDARRCCGYGGLKLSEQITVSVSDLAYYEYRGSYS
jgi:hypothetical protein